MVEKWFDDQATVSKQTIEISLIQVWLIEITVAKNTVYVLKNKVLKPWN